MLLRPLLLIAAVTAALALCGGTASAAGQHAELRYTYQQDHFTRLSVDAPVKVTVKRPGRPAQATTLKALVGVTLPVGTKIKVRCSFAAWTLKITAHGVE